MLSFKKLSFMMMLGFILFLASCEKSEFLPDHSELSNELEDQGSHRNCGMDHQMSLLLEDPDYRKFHEEKFAIIRNAQKADFRAECQNKVIVPVAVHFQRIQNPDETCLIEQALDQIQILNEDYGGTNSDIVNWNNTASSLFPGINNGEACIEFQIANKNHPNGYGLADGDLAITINQTRRENLPEWSGYINIYVKNINYLGYSPLGGSGNGDGVVIDNNSFGSISCSGTELRPVYNLGRTLTHELGHYLMLDHIWGGGCSRDDGISDTPNSAREYYGCPKLDTISCGSNDMHMNYMDYTDDACMYMFSAGQSGVMESYLNGALSNVVSNANNVIGGGTPPPPPGECTTPTGLSSSVNKKKVNLSWDAQAGATFEVQYRDVSDSTWSTLSSTSNSATLNGVRSGSYEWQVRALCGSATDWSAIATFNL